MSPYKNPEKQREYQKEWHQRNKERRREVSNKNRRERHEIVNKYKEDHPCEKCGESRFYVLDFHHKDNKDKKGTIARLIRSKYTLPVIMEEIDKCIVLCSNCHRELHYLEDSASEAQNG